jgi:hypothetical protein
MGGYSRIDISIAVEQSISAKQYFLKLPLGSITSLGYCGLDEFQRNLGKWFHAHLVTSIGRAQRILRGVRNDKNSNLFPNFGRLPRDDFKNRGARCAFLCALPILGTSSARTLKPKSNEKTLTFLSTKKLFQSFELWKSFS